MFTQCRISQFAASISYRKKSIFETEEWRTIPWLELPKTGRDVVFDIFLQLPGAIEQSDIAIASGSSELCLEAVNGLVRILSLLQTWKAQLSSTLWREAPGNPFADAETWIMEQPAYYLNHGMDVAHWIMMYWTACLHICTSIKLLSKHLPVEQRLNFSANRNFDPDTYAGDITRCIPYFWHPDAGLIGFQNVALPMGSILAYYAAFHREEPAEKERVRKMMFDASRSGPYGPLVGGFLRQMHDQSFERGSGVRTPSTERAGYEGFRSKSKSWYRVKEEEDQY